MDIMYYYVLCLSPPLTFARAHRNINRTSDTIFSLNAHVNTFVGVINWIEPIQERHWLVWSQPLLAINKITLEENLIMSLTAREVFLSPSSGSVDQMSLRNTSSSIAVNNSYTDDTVRDFWCVSCSICPHAIAPKDILSCFHAAKSTVFQSPPIRVNSLFGSCLKKKWVWERMSSPLYFEWPALTFYLVYWEHVRFKSGYWGARMCICVVFWIYFCSIC